MQRQGSAFLSLAVLFSNDLLVLAVFKNHMVDIFAAEDASPEDKLLFIAIRLFTNHGTAATKASHKGPLKLIGPYFNRYSEMVNRVRQRK
jgi:hypothetical protein